LLVAVVLLVAGLFTARWWVEEFDPFTRARFRSIQVGMAEVDVEAVLGKGRLFHMVGWRKGPDSRLVFWTCQGRGPRVLVVEFDGQGRVVQKATLASIMGPPVKDEAGLVDRLRAWLGW
jgi:hypothetical protein